ncbi:MAG TPA: hypothetical protein VHP81_00505 [Lachnospiraceae bacterium]|nr:hypothetical protein [Lachnospiraceae bacterium]
MKQLLKHFFLWLVGGSVYYIIEMVYRGYSHWSMFILGGLCFVVLGLINEFLSWKTPLWKQCMNGAVIVTLFEFITGCIVNLWLGWNVWDYSGLPFNVLGQICLPFFFIWCLLSMIGIVVDDYLRWIIFKEEKPRYRLY